MNNELLELVLKRRSIRKYKKDDIDEETINEIIKIPLASPSSFGHRPVEFVVVKDKDSIKRISECKRLGGNQIIGSSAVIVVIVNIDHGEFWIEDGAVASAYALLAAEQYNIGACWIQIRNRNGVKKTSDEEIRELLNVPDNYRVLNLIALGKKDEIKMGYKESDLDYSKIHYNSF